MPHIRAGEKQKVLQAEMDSLAKKHGGKSVPVHLTLMGGIVDDLKSAEERAQLLSSQLKVGLFTLGSVSSRFIFSEFSCQNLIC